MRLAISRAVAVEGPRGWKLSKEKQTHKIDVVVALGMAPLATVENGIGNQPLVFSDGFMNRIRNLPRKPVDYFPASGSGRVQRPGGCLDVYALGQGLYRR
jgi:hypothetical protein